MRIRSCVNRNLAGVLLAIAAHPIVMERGGVLQIVDAPEEVNRTDFRYCVRQAVPRNPPERVVISLREAGS